MNIEQAKEALAQGHRLTHPLFGKEEWIAQEGTQMIMEDGAQIDVETFWKDRSGASFTEGWELKPLRVAKWSIEHEFYANGTSKMTRTCDGYNSLELLGVVTQAQLEILLQIKGIIKPDIIKREVLQ